MRVPFFVLSKCELTSHRGEWLDARHDRRVCDAKSQQGERVLMFLCSTQVPRRNPDFAYMERLLADLKSHSKAWPFLKPVNKDEVADYYDVIKEPMGAFLSS